MRRTRARYGGDCRPCISIMLPEDPGTGRRSDESAGEFAAIGRNSLLQILNALCLYINSKYNYVQNRITSAHKDAISDMGGNGPGDGYAVAAGQVVIGESLPVGGIF